MVTWNEKRILVADVTDDPRRLHTARMMVAESYARLSSSDLDVQDVYNELCHDEYQERGFARTFLAEGFNPITGRTEGLGTLRLVLGHRHCDLPPLEIMSLMVPSGGWQAFNFSDFQSNSAAEFCRFVVAPVCRGPSAKALGLPQSINRALVDAAMNEGERRGKTQFWAIMPRYVVRVVERAGYDLSEAPPIGLNYSRHAGLFEKYDRYWLRNSPSLFRLRRETIDVLAA